jgi:hypothetical protein
MEKAFWSTQAFSLTTSKASIVEKARYWINSWKDLAMFLKVHLRYTLTSTLLRRDKTFSRNGYFFELKL